MLSSPLTDYQRCVINIVYCPVSFVDLFNDCEVYGRMKFLEFLKRESPDSYSLVLTAAVLSGLANGILLSLINTAAAAASRDTGSTRTILLFSIAMLIYVIGKKTSLTRSTKILESILKKLRLRVSDKIRNSELVLVEKLRLGELYTKIYQETNIISRTSSFVIDSAQSAIMLVFCFLYIAWLSKTAFLITAVSVSICVYSYYNLRKSVLADINEVTEKESVLVDSMTHLINGFKEIRLNGKRSDSLFGSVSRMSDETEDLRVKTGVKFASDLMFFHVFLYFLVATMIFLLPRMIVTYDEIVFKMTAAILFIIGPLASVVKGVPFIYRTDVALDNIYDLEKKLDSLLNAPSESETPEAANFKGFKNIRFRNVSFSYRTCSGDAGFQIGPVSADMRRGETVFITGDNGCGKSTFLKLLAGLYTPDSGIIEVNGCAVVPSNINNYRELISAVFTDFHLFDRLYGLEDIDSGKVLKLLHDMELENKTRFEDNRFTDINLSTSQRKRLALVVALLEDREIYLFDEWAAEQDSDFRKYFYKVILKDLKEQGKTVILVTHDDKYLYAADRILHLGEDGITEKPVPKEGKG